MVASALRTCAAEFGFDAVVLARRQVDITDAAAVAQAIRRAAPDLVIHTAAETRVDYCERHSEQALQANALGTANVRNAAAKLSAELVYISTDYVFNGAKTTPWLESDEPDPINAYGASKLAGEWAVRAYGLGRIVRTSGVFGRRGGGRQERNFFQAIAGRLAADSQPVEVVDDQLTAVTYAPHLARMLLDSAGAGLRPISHLTSAGQDSWCGWARRAAGLLGHDPARIRPVSTADMHQADRAPRPRYSVLGSEFEEIAEQVCHYPAESGLREYMEHVD
jgi:dTDP-4-dehydrorhamnose reductase